MFLRNPSANEGYAEFTRETFPVLQRRDYKVVSHKIMAVCCFCLFFFLFFFNSGFKAPRRRSILRLQHHQETPKSASQRVSVYDPPKPPASQLASSSTDLQDEYPSAVCYAIRSRDGSANRSELSSHPYLSSGGFAAESVTLRQKRAVEE